MATPPSLITAIKEGNNLETIKKLIDNGASVNELDYFEYPLDVAVDANNAEIVTLLLKYVDYDITETRHGRGKTLLHRACEAETPSVEIVRGLLEHGINVNFDDHYGETALHLACRTGNKDVVQLLIEYGINVNYVDERSDFGGPAIYCAISKDSTEILELLLKNGAEIFTTTSTNFSLLHSAISSEAWDAAKLLLRHVVHLSSQTEINWNALSCAILEKNFNLVKELRENGHGVDMLCLYTAVVCGSNEIFKLIWKNIATYVVSNDKYFMIHVFDNFHYTERIMKLWVLLNKQGVDLHLEECGKAFAFFIDRTAREAFTGVSRDEQQELLQCLASRGLRLNESDAERIISYAYDPSHTELVEDIINITLPKISRSAFRSGAENGLDEFLMQYCMDVDLETLFEGHQYEWNTDSVQRYAGLFTATDFEKDCIINTFKWQNNAEQLDRVTRMLGRVNFKSLMELSRDAVRKQLNEICTDSRHLLHILDQMHLPSIIRDIIQCKVPVNRVVYSPL